MARCLVDEWCLLKDGDFVMSWRELAKWGTKRSASDVDVPRDDVAVEDPCARHNPSSVTGPMTTMWAACMDGSGTYVQMHGCRGGGRGSDALSRKVLGAPLQTSPSPNQGRGLGPPSPSRLRLSF